MVSTELIPSIILNGTGCDILHRRDRLASRQARITRPCFPPFLSRAAGVRVWMNVKSSASISGPSMPSADMQKDQNQRSLHFWDRTPQSSRTLESLFSGYLMVTARKGCRSRFRDTRRTAVRSYRILVMRSPRSTVWVKFSDRSDRSLISPASKLWNFSRKSTAPGTFHLHLTQTKRFRTPSDAIAGWRKCSNKHRVRTKQTESAGSGLSAFTIGWRPRGCPSTECSTFRSKPIEWRLGPASSKLPSQDMARLGLPS